ncbi:MAG: hypothetical protein KMY54_00860, partial [Erysipelothrix sp.]|nr:hypothetical protein [Erysipelothrix sp.]
MARFLNVSFKINRSSRIIAFTFLNTTPNAVSTTSVLVRISQIELETRHDVVAFTRSLSESLGEEARWIHYGLTSTDVVDTALGVVFKKVNAIILEDLLILKET